jgi:hypothetical protein
MEVGLGQNEGCSAKKKKPHRKHHVSIHVLTNKIYGSIALVNFGRFLNFLIHTQSVGLIGREISRSQGRYLYTG